MLTVDTASGHPTDPDGPSAVSQVRTREDLGSALTALRAAARLSVRDVVREVPDLSLGTASGWFSGQHVPTRASESTLVTVLGILGVSEADTGDWLAAVERVRSRPGPRVRRAANGVRADAADTGGRAGVAPTGDAPARGSTPGRPGPQPTGDPDGPYVGLRPYVTADAPLFHGRAAEIDQILRRVAAGRSRPLVVIGASGSGKSSLLAAGVAPRWIGSGGGTGDDDEVTIAMVRPDEVDSELARSATYLIVDQLEELWAAEVEASRRAEVLGILAERAGRGQATVAALRADFFQSALAEPVLRGALDDPVVIGPPDREALAEIIVEPARTLGYTVEPSLVTLLVDTVAPADGDADERSLLPLLSHVLLVCWERSRRRRITVDDYYSTGGVEGAIRDTAEAVYQRLDPAARTACRGLFLRLVDVRSTRTVRRRAPLAELSADLRAVTAPFADAGLLTVDRESVTPTHEVVFSSWPRLTGWIDADRDGLRVLARVRSGAAEWVAGGRGDDALPNASSTAELLRWRRDRDAGSSVQLTDVEEDFLDAAAAHHEAAARRDRSRIRTLTTLAASLAAVTLVALVASGFALHATSSAELTRDVALSRSGSVSSTTAFTLDPGLGRALALAAYRIHPTIEARSALLNTSRADVPLRFESAPGTGRVIPLPSPGDPGTPTDPGDFVSVGADGVLRLFNDSQAGPVAALDLSSGERNELYSADLFPDGAVLAVAGQGGVHLVDVRDPSAPATISVLEAGTGPFHSVAFAPDGRTLAAGSGDGRVLRWPVTTRDGIPTVTDPAPRVAVPDPGSETPKPVESLAWLPDSATLLLANRTSGVKTLLDAGARGVGRRGPALDTGDAVPLSVTVNRDGTRVAAGTTGRTIQRWATQAGDPATARPLPELEGWNAYVTDVTYDGTGTLAATGSDERIRVYGPSGSMLTELPASQVATSVRFLGRHHLVTYSVDGLIRLWPLDRLGAASETNSIFQTASSADRTTGVLGVTASELHYTVVDTTGTVPVETGRVIPDPGTRFSGSVAMSPDGRTVYAGLADGGVQIFTAPFGPATRSAARLPVTSGVVVATPLSPDGRTLAVCSDTTPELALLDVRDPTRPRLLDTVALPDPCVVAEFSADSRQLVVPTLGPETVILDTSDPARPEEAHRLTTGIGGSPAAGYAHAAPLLATSGGDKTIRLWEVDGGDEPREVSSFTSPPGEIYWVAFSADDARLVITSSTGQVTVVDVSDPAAPQPWAVLGSTTDPLLYQGRIASPEGDLLAVGATGALWMWRLDVDRVVADACSGGVQLTSEEWERHFPDTEPFDLCP